MSLKKHPFISQHQTLNGTLMVDWSKDYHEDFQCPECRSDKLDIFNDTSLLEKCSLKCKSCGKKIKLSYENKIHVFKYQPGVSCPNSECTQLGPDGKTKGWIYLQAQETPRNGSPRSRYLCYYCRFRFSKQNKPAEKQPLISYHQTLNGTLVVDWRKDYQKEYSCLKCGCEQIYPCHNPHYPEKRSLRCKQCSHQIPLTCRNHPYIFKYQPELSCPNPVCTQLGPDGKTKGWIYVEAQLISSNKTNYRCRYCNIRLSRGNKKCPNALIFVKPVKAFHFDDDIWDTRNFYEEVKVFTINFDFEPDWYKVAAKKYVHMLLKARSHASKTIGKLLTDLRKFSRVVHQMGLAEVGDIDREVISTYINSQKHLNPASLNDSLSCIKSFCEWLGLDADQLIRRRDFLKERQSDPEWLDEIVRQGIRQKLDKIPAPIARQYLVQEYTAARPGDICLMSFECLVEENGQWYVQFYQQKVKRWHRLPASREIRQVIEAQQQWIRQTLGNDYTYLFCHFRHLHRKDYPQFLTLTPLLKPSESDPHSNVMVRTIRLLIENEDIRDGNGQLPHFTGKVMRSSKLQEVRAKYGLNAAQLYADHEHRNTTYQSYAPPTQEQLAEVDLPFQELLLNPNNHFLPWQSLPESLLNNPKAHELDMEIAPRLVVYGHCTLDPKTPCPVNLYPKCYGCNSFRPSTSKLPLYERQYVGEQERMQQAKEAEAELAYEEAKTTIEVMDKWLPALRKLANE